MRKALLFGAGIAALAGGVALAQAPGGPPPGGPPGGPGSEGPPRPGMDGGGHWMHGRGGPMMRMSKAAHFHFSRGDNEVDIRCAADEPTKACVDAASILLDKLVSQPAR